MGLGAGRGRRLSRLVAWAALVLLLGLVAHAPPASSASASSVAPLAVAPASPASTGAAPPALVPRAEARVLPAPDAQQPATIRIGVIGLTADAGIFIAEERGYFRANHL